MKEEILADSTKKQFIESHVKSSMNSHLLEEN